MSIYSLNYSDAFAQLLPPHKRLPKWLAWMGAFAVAAQWVHDKFFTSYVLGSTALDWSNVSTYVLGNRVRYIDNAVYEAIGAPPTGNVPTDTTYWYKIQSNFIGMNERVQYSGVKLMLEYALNRIFKVSPFSTQQWNTPTPPYTQIYITNTTNIQSNFWLSNGGAGALTSYLSNTSAFNRYFLGNAYAAFNSNSFTIHVPIAVYTAIGAVQPSGVTADKAIRALVDKYAQAGKFYNIVTY